MFVADQVTFEKCFATFRGVISTPPEGHRKTFQNLVRFALDSKEPHPDVWFGACLPYYSQDKRAFVWCLGSDNLTPWIGVAHIDTSKIPGLVVPQPAFVYTSIDIAIMACLHRTPKF